ncbi:MAG: hypothetical protein M1814_003855 [Vezdaea aestivalis]|nr:MAG: hypothetical protein M1814_003855 [Vezdaea aestivalis]
MAHFGGRGHAGYAHLDEGPSAPSPNHPPNYSPSQRYEPMRGAPPVPLPPSASETELADIAYHPAYAQSQQAHGQGLGITSPTNPFSSPFDRTRRPSVPRVPVGASPTSPQPQSPPSFSRQQSAGNVQFDAQRSYDTIFNKDSGHPSRESPTSPNHLSAQPQARSNWDNTSITTQSHRSVREDEQDPGCPSTKNIFQQRVDWLAGTILVLSVFSTLFSGAYVVIAISAPRYGSRIRSDGGGMLPSTASTLSALFAKMIELSFVTVFVSFLGQVLSRRAFIKNGRGITLSELSFRSWIMQPGTLITHLESVRYGALTFLGLISLTACIIAMLYTTASDALVAPILKYDMDRMLVLHGRVSTSYANIERAKDLCATPIDRLSDINPSDPTANEAGRSCLGVSMAGNAYHNVAQFYGNWSQLAKSGLGTSVQKDRPRAPAMLYDNTTVLGSWVENRNKSADSARWKRRVVNITLAMPHTGIFQAARDPVNGILQPESLGGLGQYFISASLPSPSVNVICAGLTLNETKPFALYNSYWTDGVMQNFTGPPANTTENSTAVDELFGFGPPPLGIGLKRPIFKAIPGDWNTLVNTSYFDSMSFLIGKLRVTADPPNPFPYDLCAIKSTLYPSCSTRYHSSMSGGEIESVCGVPNDKLRYDTSNSSAPKNEHQKDFASFSDTVLTSLSLGTGDVNANASNSRILTNLIPTGNESNPSLPSSAEAIAVMLGGALLDAARDSPFIHYWNYSTTVTKLDKPQMQGFNATLRQQQYASGGNQSWERGFHIVLILVFLTNLFCLVYLALGVFMRRGIVTDFTEPQNMFALTINSPRSDRLAGSCGGGPEKDQFAVPWFVKVDDHDHVYIAEAEMPPGYVPSVARRRTRHNMTIQGSPLMKSYTELSRKRQSIL